MSTRVMTIAVYDEASRWTFPQESLELVRQRTPEDVEVRLVGTRKQLLEALPETEYLVGFPFTGAQFVLHEHRVSWLQLTGRVGASLESVHQLLDNGVRITTAAGARATQVGEHALMLTLALLRGLSGSIDGQRSHRWEAERLSPLVRDLDGLRVCVLGAGAIGSAVGGLFASLGCHVYYVVDTQRSGARVGGRVFDSSSMDEPLSSADVVIVAGEFVHRRSALLKRGELQTIRPDAFLVDVSRGGLVHESDLIRALQREEIAGAALDVFEHEPPGDDNPLWTMPSVVMTPQLSGVSPRYWERVAELVVKNMELFDSGEMMEDEVRLEVGV
ncbi:MAG: NAD(P)-dependent oxidoreductase [Planctomycetota bacterium]|jgi:phosphoglycerate dehydrogenase-like enzyme